MLKKIRVGLGILLFSLITLLFLDISGSLHKWLGWLAKIQLIPAILAINTGLIVLLVLLTLIFGRAYCSTICPLGVWQDIVSWIAGKTKKNRFRYSPAITWLRYLFLAIFIISLIVGLGAVAGLLDPYGAYGRVASNLFAPIYQWGNNALAYFAERIDSYAFYKVDVWLKSLPTFIIAALTFILVGVLSWKNGRTYCNTICPVGTVLGFISKFSYLKPIFDTEKCNGCNLCIKNCKASCIDTQNHKIDYTRCVTCMNCIEKCKQGAIDYKPAYFTSANKVNSTEAAFSKEHSGAQTRRSFLSIASLLAVSGIAKAQEEVVEGSLAVIENKKVPNRTTAIVPPGAIGAKNFAQHCTACGLCISNCPNQILRPSANLMTMMQPEMSYERGYCRPECTHCAEVCPTSAIQKITKAEKSSIQIGYAVWIKDNCVVLTDDVNCGNCARHCPTGAIEMVPSKPDDDKSRKIPVVNTERCIGCGACENLCPSRPLSAIYVEGVERHRLV